MRKAMTLVEIMVVVVIIGVIAMVALVRLSGPREQVIEKEARATLRLIAAAQKIYRMEYQTYIGAVDTTEVNQMLRMRISNNSATANWNYCVTSTGTGFNATATRINFPATKKFFINESMEDADLAP